MSELTTMQSVLLLAAVAMVAFLYSSVGHGGATGYLAVAPLVGLPAAVASPGALWMNCMITSIALGRFQRASFFNLLQDEAVQRLLYAQFDSSSEEAFNLLWEQRHFSLVVRQPNVEFLFEIDAESRRS